MVTSPHLIDGAVSFIDLTISTEDIAHKITNWTVMDEENLSDHAHIIFDFDESKQGNHYTESSERLEAK